jgi:hypothetical protein
VNPEGYTGDAKRILRDLRDMDSDDLGLLRKNGHRNRVIGLVV